MMRLGAWIGLTLLALWTGADGATAENVIIYLSDQNLDAILRIQDLNDDGDYDDIGETFIVCEAEWAAGARQPVADRPQTIAAIVLTTPRNLDGDGDVDLSDLASLLGVWGTCSGDPEYDATADLDGSGCVDLADLATLLAHYGE